MPSYELKSQLQAGEPRSEIDKTVEKIDLIICAAAQASSMPGIHTIRTKSIPAAPLDKNNPKLLSTKCNEIAICADPLKKSLPFLFSAVTGPTGRQCFVLTPDTSIAADPDSS